MTESFQDEPTFELQRSQKIALIARVLKILNTTEKELGRFGTWVVIAGDWQDPRSNRDVPYGIETPLNNLPIDSIKRYERIPSASDQRRGIFSINVEFFPWGYSDHLLYKL